MKSTYSRKKPNVTIIVALLILFLCVAASLAVLFGRMLSYTQTEFENVIPLINVNTRSLNEEENNTLTYSAVSDGESSGSHPEFRMNAKAEIFKISYKNNTGSVTVGGSNSSTDKLIAPGTSNKYQFTLENPGDVALDYTLSMEANITGTDETIPVKVRVWDYENKYLLGSSEQMKDVLDLSTVNEKSVLGAGRSAVYTLEWKWPFEQDNDEIDTILGNLASEDDIALEVNINTIAQYNGNPDNNSVGLMVPQTGDDSPLEYLLLILAASIVGIFVVIFANHNSKKKNSGKNSE